MSKAPETIYLQHCDDEECKGECIAGTEATWCSDAINDNDVKYFHASEVERLRAEMESMEVRYYEELGSLGADHSQELYKLAQENERLKQSLTQIRRNATVMTAHQIEQIAKEALTKEI